MMVSLQGGLLVKINGKGDRSAVYATWRDKGGRIERLSSLLGPYLNVDGLRRRGAGRVTVHVRAGTGIDGHSASRRDSWG